MHRASSHSANCVTETDFDMGIIGQRVGQASIADTQPMKRFSPFEKVRDVIVYLLFATSLASTRTLRCTSPINDPKIIKNCEKQCSTSSCPSYCSCKPVDAFCGDFSQATDSCNALDFAPSKLVSVREDLPAGTNIFSIVVRGSETWSFELGRSDDVDGSAWSDLKSYLAFKMFGSKYEMIVNKTLDLENIFQRNSIQLSTLILILKCKRPNLPTETLELLLQVLPVNEFAPQFIGAPFRLSIPEDTSIGTQLIQMDQVTIDRDVNPATRELSRFAIHDYMNSTQRDGQPYFSMNNIQKGNIILRNAVDFEALDSLGSTRFMLNVSAAVRFDTNGRKAYTQIQINVTDVNDLPPEFFHPSCPLHIRRLRPCPVSFEADIPVGYKGRIHRIQPQDIHAHDMDALDAAISYTLYNGPGESKVNADKFSINKTTGALYLTSPFLVATHVDLVVVASENTTKAMTTQAPLKIIVKDMPVDVVQLENILRPNSQLAGGQTADNKDNLQSNPLFLGILIVLTATTLILIIIIAIILIKMKCARHLNPTVHPVARNETYDEPSSYHFSHDEMVATKTTHLPSYASDRHQRENPQQNSEKSMESQMTSKILSSTSQIAKNKAQKLNPTSGQALLTEQNRAHNFEGSSPNSTGQKTSESEEETEFSSDPSSLKSSPLPLPNSSGIQPMAYPLGRSSHYDGAKNDRLSKLQARDVIYNHMVMQKRSCISDIEQGTTSVASSDRHVQTYPVMDRRLVSKRREKPQSYKGSQGRKSENILDDQHTDRNGKEYSRRNQRFNSQERRIRIPSGILVMTPSYEDHAIDQSGDDSNDSTLNDEPIIDVFHESPSVSYHEAPQKEIPIVKSPRENNVLSLLPENLLSESDNGEILTLTKSGRGRLAPVCDLRSHHKPSSINPKPEEMKARNKTVLPQPTITYPRATDFKSQSQAMTDARSLSLVMIPDDEITVGSLRPASEADVMIRRKKKRRRILSQQSIDKFAIPVSHSQGDDRSREKQKRPTSSNRRAIAGHQDDIHKHRRGELGQMHNTGFQDSSSGFDN